MSAPARREQLAELDALTATLTEGVQALARRLREVEREDHRRGELFAQIGTTTDARPAKPPVRAGRETARRPGGPPALAGAPHNEEHHTT